MSSKLIHIEANPNYGSGVFRRRILLRSAGQRVIAELEDDNHAFRISMGHDGRVITEIESEFLRVPKSTCDGARDPLMVLVGSPLSNSPLALCDRTDPRANCTHAFDLLSLAVTHAKREEKQRQYDALLWDECEGEMRFELQRNGEDFLSGMLRGGEFISPDPFTGKNLRKGFTSWARDALDHEQLEAALVLQRAHFVSITRRILMDGLAGSRVADEPMAKGVCYSYNPGVIEGSINTPDVRDYSEAPEKMLAFRRSLD
jgi:hypothetical protein